MPYEDQLPAIAPPLPSDGKTRPIWWPRWFRAVGRRMDQITQLFRNAVLARLPTPGAADDALEQIGRDRQLPRAPGETSADYAAYLVRAWEVWAGDNTPVTGRGGGAGSRFGLLTALRRAGFPSGTDGAMIVAQNGRYYRLDDAGELVVTGSLQTCANRIDLTGEINPRPGWWFDGRDNFWSVFGIIFPVATVIDGPKLNAIVAQWKQSKELYVGAVVITIGRLLGWPPAKFGDGHQLGASASVYIPPGSGDDGRIRYMSIRP